MIISADRIVTGDGTTVLEKYGVLVTEETGKIKEVASIDTLKLKYPDEMLFDYKEATLLPGLIDMHVHLGSWRKIPIGYLDNDFIKAFITVKNARSIFKYGVTTIRDVCTKDRLSASICWASNNGIINEPIPRIIPCGNGICMTGGHGSEFGVDGGDEADGPWMIRKLIREKIKCGSQWIKLLTSRRDFIPEFTQEELNAAVDECHRVNKKIAVHSGVPITIQMCIDAGVDTIEHGTFMSVEQAYQMQEKGIAWIPTIIAYTRGYEKLKKIMSEGGINPDQDVNYKYFQKAAQAYRENFKMLHDTGIKIAAGTDLSLCSGEGTPVAKELQYMVQYGLEPIEAIRIWNGKRCGCTRLDGYYGENCRRP